MTDFLIQHREEDFATLVIRPGRDDFFAVEGYNDGSVEIRLPIYDHEARFLQEAIKELVEAAVLS